MFSMYLKRYQTIFVLFLSVFLIVTLTFANIARGEDGEGGGPGAGPGDASAEGTGGTGQNGDAGGTGNARGGSDNCIPGYDCAGGGGGTIIGYNCSGGDNNFYCAPIYAPPEPVFVPVPTCSVSVNPTSITQGGASTLSWNSTYIDYTNVHAVLASYSDDIAAASYPPNVTDYNAPSGSAVIHPTYSRTYTVTFYSGSTGQQCTAGAGISVSAPPPPPPPPPPPSSATQPPPAATPPATAACPSGQHAVGALCVCNSTNLPADSNGQCTSQICPSGFLFDPGSGQCIAINQCALPRICSDNTRVLNQCTGAVLNCALNGTGWVCRNGDCVKLPEPLASISAAPSLLSSGYTTNIAWTSQNTDSCRVTGNNGDGVWSGTSGSRTSSPIQAQTIYTLSCEGVDGSTITKTATVNIIPREIEL